MLMHIQCCVCRKILRGAQWVPVAEEKLAGKPVSHSYCPPCSSRSLSDMKRKIDGSYRNPGDGAWQGNCRRTGDRRREIPAHTVVGLFLNTVGIWQQDMRLQMRRA